MSARRVRPPSAASAAAPLSLRLATLSVAVLLSWCDLSRASSVAAPPVASDSSVSSDLAVPGNKPRRAKTRQQKRSSLAASLKPSTTAGGPPAASSRKAAIAAIANTTQAEQANVKVVVEKEIEAGLSPNSNSNSHLGELEELEDLEDTAVFGPNATRPRFSRVFESAVKDSLERPLTSTVGTILVTVLVLRLCSGGGEGKGLQDCLKAPHHRIKRSNSVVGLQSNASVEVCRSEERGRFKHCGLRSDPIDETQGPPEYSLKPVDTPLPPLSRDQRRSLDELAQRVDDLSFRTRTDSPTIVRYLRARKWNVAAAEKYFREAEAWRRKRNCERALMDWNLDVYEKMLAPWWLSGGFLGHGKNGEQIGYERLAICHWHKLVEKVPWEQIEYLDIVHCMRSLAAIEEDCHKRGERLGNGILVQDCEGFTWEQATWSSARNLSRLINMRGMIMPECISRILVVRAPQALVYAWKMFKNVLDPGVREKVRIVGHGEELACLREFISDDQIPAFLGGSLRIEDDPECRRVLAPGGVVPEAVVQEFLRAAANGPERSQAGQQGRVAAQRGGWGEDNINWCLGRCC